MNADIDTMNAQIRQLEEEQYKVDKELLSAQRDEEEEEQYTNREILELSFMREDFRGDIRVLQALDEKHDSLSRVKKERTEMLHIIDDKRKNSKIETESRIDELQKQIRKVVKKDDD